MTDMPDPSSSSLIPQVPTAVSSVTSSGNKEIMRGGIPVSEETIHDATGQEFELPKEVHAAGVRMQPTTVSIPAPVASLGVKPAGANIPVQTASTVALPLSDDQIAKGLHESITNSVRWLAEWCVRRLKHFHIRLKEVQGKYIEVKEG